MPHPEGTRAWRKSHRRKWREESSFRGLSMTAKLVVVWVEDNADDDGRVTTTVRYLAAMLSGSHPRQRVPRMTAWRALREAVDAGVLVTQAGQEAGQEAGQAPTVITRVNFKDYQARPEASGTGHANGMEAEAGLSGRGRQKETNNPTPDGVAPVLSLIPGEGKPKPVRKARKQSPELEAARARLEAVYVGRFPGASLPWTGSCWGYLTKMLQAGTEDGLAASWTAFLASKYYPEKSFFIFATRAYANVRFSAEAAAPKPQPRRAEEFF